ncbi:MAG: oligopeptide/dipeptide ABC transporter ATP-binding protein [Ilumatobacteraceae bacterium]
MSTTSLAVDPTAGVEELPVLDLKNVSVRYPGHRRVPWRRQLAVDAVRDVSLHIMPGETLGLVGESGSGKSTLGRAILRLVDVATGTVHVSGEDVTAFGRRVPVSYRRAVQVVWQDPYSSLNPTMSIGQTMAESLRLHRGLRGSAVTDAATELMERVGLNGSHLRRHPHEFSGGQRQRIAIARALAAQPKLIVLDEPVSALDVSTQSQVIGLLEDLQAETGVAYLFIAHDLPVVRHISDRIAVMYRGRIVETGPADRLCDNPAHPYTEALLAASPIPDPVEQRRRSVARRDALREQLASADSDSGADGCPFRHRCTMALPECVETFPITTPVSSGGEVACYLQTFGPRLEGRDLTALGDHKISV